MASKISRRNFLKNNCLVFSAPILLQFISEDNQLNIINQPTGIANKIPFTGDIERIKSILSNKENHAKWVFVGDSITHGAKHTHGMRSYPEIFSERIRWELGRVSDLVINMGVNGAILTQILKDFEWRVAQFNPSVVFIMIGTNDCTKNKKISTIQFSNSIVDFILKVRSLGAIPILLTPNLIIESQSPGRELLKDYVSVLIKVAKEQNLIISNNWEYWFQNLNHKYEKSVFKEWLNDSIHPNGLGHQQIAQLLFKSLDIFNPADPTCGGSYYEGVH